MKISPIAIQLRAVKRIGELLVEIEPGTGKYQSKKDGAVPLDRKTAADAAGVSERQRKSAACSAAAFWFFGKSSR